LDAPIKDGDEVSIKSIEKVIELLEYLDLDYHDAEMKINGRKAELHDPIHSGDHITYKVLEKAESNTMPKVKAGANSVNVVLNGKPAVLQANKSQCLFVDILNNIDIDVNNVKGSVIMLLNGNKANYSDVIKDGDNIEFYWSKE